MTEFFDSRSAMAAPADPGALLTACIEAGRRLLLIDSAALPAAFFDLSTGMAGAFVQRLRNYGIKAALIVPDRTIHSQPFQDFAREADRGSLFRFFADRADAVTWLTGTLGP